MAEINVLTPNIFNKISAGEVVEKPASVVKELVENSIDAGATSIFVEIKEGGIKQIIVADDGCGIEKHNLNKVFLPHATSKIEFAEDLESISTLGFRGEAVASIAAVAKVELQSRFINEEIGNKLTCFGGEFGEIEPCGMNVGTRFIVNDLFFNTPVRAKFLKKPKLEESDITFIIRQIMLANPNLSFKYIADNNLIYQSNGGVENTIYSVYSREIADSLIPVRYTKDNYTVQGFIGKRGQFKHNRTYQTFILNGRLITNVSVSACVAQAYGNALMTRTYPIFILNLSMPFDEVDVNVHPSKSDVRFRDSRKVLGIIYNAVLNSLESEGKYININNQTKTDEKVDNILSEEVVINNENPIEIKSKEENFKVQVSKLFDRNDGIENSGQMSIDDILQKQEKKIQEMNIPNNSSGFDIATLKVASPRTFNQPANMQNMNAYAEESSLFSEIEKELVGFRIVGQVFNTYLIIEDNEKVYLIDQHAAHEKILYDELKDKLDQNKIQSQYMLSPFIFECNANEYEFILNILDDIRGLGFDIDEFGGMAFKISAVPYILSNINLNTFFAEILQNRIKKETKISDIFKDKLAQTACKAAIKGGDSLDNSQIESLLKQMKNGIPTQCPHGRPAVLVYERKDFDKLFRRIV